VLVGGITLTELSRRGMLPETDRMSSVPTTHLAAIGWTVTVLLIYEVVEMLRALPRSVAASVARHLQLYALVLLRDAFAELSTFEEPIRVTLDDAHALGVMGSDALGAVLLFLGATLFSRMQAHRPITKDTARVGEFVRMKRAIALSLVGILAALCVRDAVSLLWGEQEHRLFDTFFTVLIFVDVLLAVISLAYTEIPAVVFRNFGFALAAILLRLAIASPEFLRPLLGVAGAVTAIGVTLAYNLAIDRETPGENPHEPIDDIPDDPPPEDADAHSAR